MLPHERFVRAWLLRSGLSVEDAEEVLQDCYCRFALLETTFQIQRPDAYFFATARNMMIRRRRREKIIAFEALSENEIAGLIDETPSPERDVAARLEIARLREAMDDLPARCRKILELRKFEGLSQKEIAGRVGVSESIVENDLQKGMRCLDAAWRLMSAEPNLGVPDKIATS